jgi:hypothetical protein
MLLPLIYNALEIVAILDEFLSIYYSKAFDGIDYQQRPQNELY